MTDNPGGKYRNYDYGYIPRDDKIPEGYTRTWRPCMECNSSVTYIDKDKVWHCLKCGWSCSVDGVVVSGSAKTSDAVSADVDSAVSEIESTNVRDKSVLDGKDTADCGNTAVAENKENRMAKGYTENEMEIIRKGLESGKKITEIADEIGRDPSALSQKIKTMREQGKLPEGKRRKKELPDGIKRYTTVQKPENEDWKEGDCLYKDKDGNLTNTQLKNLVIMDEFDSVLKEMDDDDCEEIKKIEDDLHTGNPLDEHYWAFMQNMFSYTFKDGWKEKYEEYKKQHPVTSETATIPPVDFPEFTAEYVKDLQGKLKEANLKLENVEANYEALELHVKGLEEQSKFYLKDAEGCLVKLKESNDRVKDMEARVQDANDLAYQFEEQVLDLQTKLKSQQEYIHALEAEPPTEQMQKPDKSRPMTSNERVANALLKAQDAGMELSDMSWTSSKSVVLSFILRVSDSKTEEQS